MPNRQTVLQRRPDPDRDYRRFPYRTVKTGSRWYRQHDKTLGPWWFSSSMQGRFDLPAPNATCYLASTRESATRERIGPDIAATGQVAISVLQDRVVSTLALPEDVRAANLDSDRAAGHYGVTAELAVMTPYEVTQAWALALHTASFGGVLGRLRFTLSRQYGLAFFGGAGPPRPRWGTDSDPEPLVDVARRMGISIVRPPDDDQVTVVGPS